MGGGRGKLTRRGDPLRCDQSTSVHMNKKRLVSQTSEVGNQESEFPTARSLFANPVCKDVQGRSYLKGGLVCQVLVDIGAGIGMFSLAAAARGHSVIAFEMAEKSLQSFRASIAYNGFEPLIKVHQVTPLPWAPFLPALLYLKAGARSIPPTLPLPHPTLLCPSWKHQQG